MAILSIPTGAQLPSNLRIDCSNRAVQKSLNRLSRPSLLTLALSWTNTSPSSLSVPRLLRDHLRERRGVELDSDDEDDYEHEFEDEAFIPARSFGQLQRIYEKMEGRKGPKSEVLGRITECDWKQGITLYQLAMADFQYLTECPLALKWAAYRVVPLRAQLEDAHLEDEAEVDDQSLALPSFHPPSFLRNLQAQVLPDVKVHYCFDRHGTLPLMLLRILVLDSPYNTSLALANEEGNAGNFDSSRTVYVAFPDSSPYVYISKAQTNVSFQAGDAKSLHNLIIESIPKALSRGRERFALKTTDLSTRNLAELVERKGPNRTNRAGGGWSFYSDKTEHKSPLVTTLQTPQLPAGRPEPPKPTAQATRKRVLSPVSQRDERLAKRARLVAKARFGESNKIDDGKGVERVDVVIHDPFPGNHPVEDEDQRNAGQRNAGQRNAEEASRLGEDAPPLRRSVRNRAGRRSDIDIALDRGRAALEEDTDELEGPWRPEIKLTFHGAHVFAGIRQLVEHGIIDGERMPGWMTGQEGVTVGVVQHGRIRGSKN